MQILHGKDILEIHKRADRGELIWKERIGGESGLADNELVDSIILTMKPFAYWVEADSFIYNRVIAISAQSTLYSKVMYCISRDFIEKRLASIKDRISMS